MTITVDELLNKLIELKGSDLHIIVGLHPAVRKDGELYQIPGYDRLDAQTVKEMTYNILTPEQINNFENDKDSRHELDFAYSISGVGRFRCNIHKQRGTIGVTVRALSSNIPKIQSLGLPESVMEFTKAKKGLILVTGPTGSGKSTTLASIIDCINETRKDHIITIEDPIEYLHNSKQSYVTQREVGFAADTLSFKNALKYALRQDPDVILIGEMRDYETMGIAITSAETGHLVFGTLHTSSAAQTVGRIIDVFPTDQQPQVRAQLSANLVGVVSQLLLPKADQSGRCIACEVMKINPAIKNNIRTNNVDSVYQTIQTSTGDGMQTMDQALIKLVKDGMISYETAYPYIRDENTHRTLAPFAKAPVEPSMMKSQEIQQETQPAPAKTIDKTSSFVKPPWEQ